MTQLFTHIAVTVPRQFFDPALRAELLAFYADVFGWTENPRLAIEGERIFLRAPSDRQYVTIRASDTPMRTSGYEHLGVAVAAPEDVRQLHERAPPVPNGIRALSSAMWRSAMVGACIRFAYALSPRSRLRSSASSKRCRHNRDGGAYQA
jgi:hypothetical protein